MNDNLEKVIYPYAKGSLLENRNTYQYSAYLGTAFLQAWKDERLTVLNRLPSPQPPPAPEHNGSVDMSQPFATEKLLEDLYFKMRGETQRLGYLSSMDQFALDQLIQRFEVTKRIHTQYTPQFRAVDKGSYHDLRLYVRFSELMALSYERTNDLPCLNALLKCLDTLCALTEFLDLDLKGRLAGLVQKEINFCQLLQARFGIVP